MRVKQFLQMAAERPDVFDYDLIRVSVMVNFALLRTSVRGARARLNTRQFDISNVGSLPERFVFYPLQYTPESSINVPAPYFVDQMRVVDALRFAMPSDCMLVIKEHPACLEMRPPKFMRQLRSRPGLLVAKCSIPSIELVRRAAATITVTGTAALEAFLLGRPALTLGTAVPTWVLDGATDLRNLRAEIRRAIDQAAERRIGDRASGAADERPLSIPVHDPASARRADVTPRQYASIPRGTSRSFGSHLQTCNNGH
jgi:hypothetical protein